MSDLDQVITQALHDRADAGQPAVPPPWQVLQRREHRRRQRTRGARVTAVAAAAVAGLLVVPQLRGAAEGPAVTDDRPAAAGPAVSSGPSPHTSFSGTATTLLLVVGELPATCLSGIRVVDLPGPPTGKIRALEVPEDAAAVNALFGCLPEGAFVGSATAGQAPSTRGGCGDVPAAPTTPALQDLIGRSLPDVRAQAARQNRPTQVIGVQGMCIPTRAISLPNRISLALRDGVVVYADYG